MSGKLLVVATPIGNLNDLSARVKTCLEECDLVLAEDTRVSIRILNHLKIKKRMLSCHDFNEASRLALIAEASQSNQTIALLSDAGTPLISDPGYQIVQQAIASNMQIIPIPGPSAFLLALIVSGLPCNRFAFEGFLPDKASAAKQKLEELACDSRTIVFYVSPHKIGKTLTLMRTVLGDRQACLARELTKLHEETLRGTLSQLQDKIAQKSILGECVLVLAGAEEFTYADSEEDINKRVSVAIGAYLEEGLGVKEISTKCAKEFGLQSSIVYKLALGLINKDKIGTDLSESSTD